MANKYTKIIPDMQKLCDLYELGMTQHEVAEEMGLTQKIVWRCLRDAKVKCRKDAPRNQKKSNNNNWKGDTFSYSAFHYRIKALKGSPYQCEICGTQDRNKHYDWANLTGKFNDPSDYKRMCRSCHWKYDQKYLNFKGASGGRHSKRDRDG